ncbi:MAG: hypothetical protein ACI9KN_000081 [Gammaproteobacteria bacterium]|jgi:uncharacterized protein YqeY
MTDATLKEKLQSDMKSSMKGGDKARLLVIRTMLAAIKQIEVDERIELDDARIVAVLDKMSKQRRESISQFTTAGRSDLIEIEEAELVIIKEYLPEALSEAKIAELIDQAITATGATSIKEMGKVMGILKPQLQGRADVGQVSQQIKSRLT